METKKSTIKEFLSQDEKYFIIPVYQRNFCWMTHQCRKLFDDIFKCLMFNKRHFLGTICYKAEDKNNIVIDGQQRITCLSILLKALYNLSQSTELKARIQNYLVSPFDNTRKKVKLKPVKKDADIYNRILSYYKISTDDFDENEKLTPLFNAYQCFVLWIEEELSGIDDYENKLLNAIESLEIIEIIVTDENPQEIFESLNATGMSLTEIDILRNYLLMTVPYEEQKRLYETYWLPMEENVGDEIQDYICSFLVMVRKSNQITINNKQWKISKRSICNAFREHYYTAQSVEALEKIFSDMCDFSYYYKRTVFDKKLDFASLFGTEKLLYELCVILKGICFKPLIMYLFKEIDDERLSVEELNQILQMLISYSFRNYVCGNNPFTNYQISGFLLSKISKYVDGDDYIALFKRAICSGHGRYAFPQDLQFENALVENQINSLTDQKIKYMLYLIEKEMNDGQPVAISGGSIEHIMPKTLSDAWKKYIIINGDKNMYEEKLNSIGNLTLTESNSALSNKSFDDKKAIYLSSVYKMTRDICKNTSWTAEAINKRAKELFQFAKKIWPTVGNVSTDTSTTTQYNLNSDINEISELKPASFSFLGEEVPVNSWSAVAHGVMVILNTVVPEQVEEAMMRLPSEIAGMISTTPDYKKNYSKIGDNVYLNQSKRASVQIRQLKTLLQYFSRKNPNLYEELWFTVIEIDDDSIIVME